MIFVWNKKIGVWNNSRILFEIIYLFIYLKFIILNFWNAKLISQYIKWVRMIHVKLSISVIADNLYNWLSKKKDYSSLRVLQFVLWVSNGFSVLRKLVLVSGLWSRGPCGCVRCYVQYKPLPSFHVFHFGERGYLRWSSSLKLLNPHTAHRSPLWNYCKGWKKA